MRYVDSLRTHGHRAARIDPLDLLQREEVAALDPTRYGLVDPSAKYDINGIIWDKPVGTSSNATANSVPESAGDFWTLEEIVRHLRGIYVGRIAYEYMHSPSKTERLWFSHMLESKSATSMEGQEEANKRKLRIHELLAQSEVFDQFLQAKFPNLKRYGLEGGESMIPALDTLFQVAAQGRYHTSNGPNSSADQYLVYSWRGTYCTRNASPRPSELTHWSFGILAGHSVQQD